MWIFLVSDRNYFSPHSRSFAGCYVAIFYCIHKKIIIIDRCCHNRCISFARCMRNYKGKELLIIMKQTYMKEKPILPLLLSMSLPMVLSMLVNSLYNIIDSYFVAMISEDAMTALSLVFPIQNFINAVGVGFGIGINAAIAFFLGAGKQKKADTAASAGLALSVVHGIILTAASICSVRFFLQCFTKDTQIVQMGCAYAYIAFAFSIIINLEITWEKIFQSVGRMMVSMICMMSGCIANIILDPLLIFGVGPFPAMGIEGAAWATGFGQLITLVLYLLFYIRQPLPVCITRNAIKNDRALIGRLYAVGIPATLNMALPSLLISALNAILSVYSQMYIVILGIYYKLQTFLYLPANGLIQGMRPLIGYNYGAGEHKRVHLLHRYTLALCAAIMAAGTLLCQILPGSLIGLFTSNPATISAGSTALRLISLGFVISAVSVATSGALEGLGKGVASLIISLCRNLLIILPCALLLSHLLGATGVWYAFALAELITAVISVSVYKKSV